MTHSEATASQVFWGSDAGGRHAHLYTLRNDRLEVAVSDYGARLVRILAPDRNGHKDDVIHGFDTFEAYVNDAAYMGATIGRFANRIAAGCFSLDGESFEIARPPNEIHALHGGKEGFDRRIWQTSSYPNGLRMALVSPDGDMGFPGRLDVSVCYTLVNSALQIEFHAATAVHPTVINLTTHPYFNLNSDRGEVLDHLVQIFANQIVAINFEAIPTGELMSVNGTPFDFLTPHPIGLRLSMSHRQLLAGDGFNHSYVLAGEGGQLKVAAKVAEPCSGRTLTILTTAPGLQFYTGNALPGEIGRHGQPYTSHTGFSLETQHFPDSPNHPEFPSTVLRPGEAFYSRTVLEFGNDYKG
jgi:aldose 1-epimerase